VRHFVLAGIPSPHAMRALRWVRAHYDALRSLRCHPVVLGLLCSSIATGGSALAIEPAALEGRVGK